MTYVPILPRDVAGMGARLVDRMETHIGRDALTAGPQDWLAAVSLVTRDHVAASWVPAKQRVREQGAKRVYYLSLEFLIGRLLFDTLNNLGLIPTMREALAELGVDLDALYALEPDAALGNGGLGRLAACFMESMATTGVPGFGYGIRYEHGLFRQSIVDGWQHEAPETWLERGNPWEFARPEVTYDIGFGGYVAEDRDAAGLVTHTWHPGEIVRAVAHDTPVVGYGGTYANSLRLWSAHAPQVLNLELFNHGDHVGAMADRVRLEAISRVLYPGDESQSGQELRLRQQFFFASASLQDLLRRHIAGFGQVASLPDHAAIQLNDTHPAIGIAELMRLLVDEHRMAFETAWAVTQRTFSYTNHTLLPEALETWSVSLLARLLPRHMQIIYQLNAIHLDRLRGEHATDALVASVSLIAEGFDRRVRMGNLAFLGSHTVNGVSALHTDLLRRTVFRDMIEACGDKVVNVTNGITFRRWLHTVNPGLTRLLVDMLGEGVLKDPGLLAGLSEHVRDPALRKRLIELRRGHKIALGRLIAEVTGVTVSPDALFDVQIKRIHEYKRQLLNILQAVAAYRAIRANPGANWVPRVKIFAGKAAPGYLAAKQIIRLAYDVAQVVNADPLARDKLSVAFLPNYNVSLAERIIPAADLSEQISTAGMEASGTGNMKLALNGALTIGTLDGANVEIREHVGEDNIFIFGLGAEAANARRAAGGGSHDAVEASPVLRGVLDEIASGAFSRHDPGRYKGLVASLLNEDRFLVAVDFDAYVAAQAEVDAAWTDEIRWWRASIHNTARVAWFSSDRSIGEYAEKIWRVPPRAGS
jgi:starch phosphorylase